jgi:hypothetical protein
MNPVYNLNSRFLNLHLNVTLFLSHGLQNSLYISDILAKPWTHFISVCVYLIRTSNIVRVLVFDREHSNWSFHKTPKYMCIGKCVRNKTQKYGATRPLCSMFNPYPANVENMLSSYNASRWQMGFNSAFKRLRRREICEEIYGFLCTKYFNRPTVYKLWRNYGEVGAVDHNHILGKFTACYIVRCCELLSAFAKLRKANIKFEFLIFCWPCISIYLS